MNTHMHTRICAPSGETPISRVVKVYLAWRQTRDISLLLAVPLLCPLCLFVWRLHAWLCAEAADSKGQNLPLY